MDKLLKKALIFNIFLLLYTKGKTYFWSKYTAYDSMVYSASVETGHPFQYLAKKYSIKYRYWFFYDDHAALFTPSWRNAR